MNESELKKLLPNLRSRPHVVILGAGASCATILNGDKNGRKISVMNNFITELKMDDILASVNLKTTSNNLEDIYSELDERIDCDNVKIELEKRICEYFQTLILPDEPTIYDCLLLSLRKDDLIISFNWDNLLLQARKRVTYITDDLPQMAFLHGNIGVGYCKNDPGYGFIGHYCKSCGAKYRPSQLLFPIKKKDYNSSINLTKQWEGTERYINDAGIITIFGYGAPDTDVEAKNLLLNAFKCFGEDRRMFEKLEIIDKPGLDYSEIYDKWKDFIDTAYGHYDIKSSFFDSTLAKSPRRSVAAHIKSDVEGCWNGFSISFSDLPKTFDEIERLVYPLLENEENLNFDVI